MSEKLHHHCLSNCLKLLFHMVWNFNKPKATNVKVNEITYLSFCFSCFASFQPLFNWPNTISMRDKEGERGIQKINAGSTWSSKKHSLIVPKSSNSCSFTFLSLHLKLLYHVEAVLASRAAAAVSGFTVTLTGQLLCQFQNVVDYLLSATKFRWSYLI